MRASHIKPWADCATDTERLGVFNGILLSPTLDAAFDRGFITLADDGAIVISDVLTEQEIAALALGPSMHMRAITFGHRKYLQWHHSYLFRCAQQPQAEGM